MSGTVPFTVFDSGAATHWVTFWKISSLCHLYPFHSHKKPLLAQNLNLITELTPSDTNNKVLDVWSGVKFVKKNYTYTLRKHLYLTLCLQSPGAKSLIVLFNPHKYQNKSHFHFPLALILILQHFFSYVGKYHTQPFFKFMCLLHQT